MRTQLDDTTSQLDKDTFQFGELPFFSIDSRATLPTRGSVQSAGLDLYAIQDEVVGACQSKLIRTGLTTIIPDGHYGRVAPRSGLALRHRIDVLAGVIDSDYRGEIGVILINFGDKEFHLQAGDRIAQLIIEKILMLRTTNSLLSIDKMQNYGKSLSSGDERGRGGFGSTGR